MTKFILYVLVAIITFWAMDGININFIYDFVYLKIF